MIFFSVTKLLKSQVSPKFHLYFIYAMKRRVRGVRRNMAVSMAAQVKLAAVMPIMRRNGLTDSMSNRSKLMYTNMK